MFIKIEFNPIGMGWYTNMAAVSLFWNTKMTAVTSYEKLDCRQKNAVVGGRGGRRGGGGRASERINTRKSRIVNTRLC